MKTLSRQLLYVSLLAASIVSCKHNNDPEPQKISKIVFWTSNDAVKNIKVDCYVDGRKIGTLSRITDDAPGCSDTKSPVATVEPGSHYCEFRAANGQTIEVDLDTEANQCYDVELF
ncbi:hypothetical protein GCM10023189_12470 [Nibrella saemangeumensis]|uniref:Lipoprotein n=1 Tax=Nibrella saemangeumensis TaxID=1084526 RepID=A0ABP8MLM8_9BACT